MMSRPRTRTIKEIKRRIREWARTRGFPVSFVRITEDRKTVTLRCALHGKKKRSVGKVCDRGQLCDDCAREANKGRGSPRFIPLQEKQRRFKRKHPHSLLRLRAALPGSRVSVFCSDCKKSTTMGWDSLIHQGPTTCKPCSDRRRGTRQLLDAKSAEERCAALGLRLAEPYRGSHYLHDIECLRCHDTKQLKPNSVWGRKGMSCRCTKSTPLYCADLIANSIGAHDAGITTECKYPRSREGRRIDIWCPTLARGFEVKYGVHAFGRKDGRRNAAYRRYTHVLSQAQDYMRARCNVSYIVIAPPKTYWVPPYIRRGFRIYDLSTLHSITHRKTRLLSEDVIDTLRQLFFQPSMIRGLVPCDSVERQGIRATLAQYLSSHGNIFPFQREIKEHFGFTFKKVYSALGLDARANRVAVSEACKHFLGITPLFRRAVSLRVASAPHQPVYTQQDIALRQRVIVWLKSHRRLPTEAESPALLGRTRTRLSWLLDLRHADGARPEGKKVIDAINALPEMVGCPIWDLPTGADALQVPDKQAYAALKQNVVRSGLCAACKQASKHMSGVLCARCAKNAERYVRNEASAMKRALVYVEKGLNREVSDMGTAEWRSRLSASRRAKLPTALRSVLAEIEATGCLICGAEVHALTGLCYAHHQAVKKYWLDAQGATHEARLHYLTEMRQRLKAVMRAQSYSVEQLRDVIDPLFCAHDYRWMSHATRYLEYLNRERRHPTQTSQSTGLLHAVWRDRAMMYSKGDAVDRIRHAVLRALKTCRL